MAIALIPGLLFGGAMLQLREEGPGPPRSHLLRIGVVVFLCGGVMAEVFAIRGAIDPASIRDWEQRWIVFMLTTGTVGVAYWCALPLLRDDPESKWLRLGRPLLLLVLIAAAVAGQFTITDSLQNAQARVRYEGITNRSVRVSREARAAERGEAEYRARLINLARSSRSSGEVLRVVLLHLRQIDDGPLRIARKPGLTLETVDEEMTGAINALWRIDDRLERAFLKGVPNLSAEERQLLYLAEGRLIAAVEEEMASVSSNTLTFKELQRACEDLSGCVAYP